MCGPGKLHVACLYPFRSRVIARTGATLGRSAGLYDISTNGVVHYCNSHIHCEACAHRLVRFERTATQHICSLGWVAKQFAPTDTEGIIRRQRHESTPTRQST